MTIKNQTELLNDAISLLENKRANELKLLKDQFHLVHESIKPINLIKNVLQEVTESSEIKNNIANNTIGLAAGYLTKKAIFGTARNPITKIFGTLLQFAITNFVSKHTDNIKSTGRIILHRFLKLRNESK